MPGDGSGQLAPEDRQAMKELGHANAHAGRATGQLVRSTEDGDGLPASPSDRGGKAGRPDRAVGGGGAKAHRPAAPSLVLGWQLSGHADVSSRHAAACSCPACAPPAPAAERLGTEGGQARHRREAETATAYPAQALQILALLRTGLSCPQRLALLRTSCRGACRCRR